MRRTLTELNDAVAQDARSGNLEQTNRVCDLLVRLNSYMLGDGNVVWHRLYNNWLQVDCGIGARSSAQAQQRTF